MENLTPAEEGAIQEFSRRRHSQAEWKAFFAFYLMSPWKRKLGRLLGSLIFPVLKYLL